MTTVRLLLNQKGHDVFSVQPDATVFDAIQKMADKNVGALVVLEDDKIVGIFTERHYARNVILEGRSSPKTPVRDIMRTRVIYARPEQTIDECMAVMSERRVRHLPIMEDVRLIGIVSIGDLVKSKIAEQQFIIEQLEHYIAG